MSERENRLINETASEPWRVTSIVQHAAPVATVDGITLELLALTEGSANPRAEMFLQGWAVGWESRQAEIDGLNFTADRLYAEMCRRVPPRQADLPSFADLERRRGNPEHADLIEAANVRRFAEVNS